MTDHAAALIAAAKPFWDAEAEITRRFFAGPPSRDDYIHYLRSAVYKELNPVIGYGPTDGFANGLHMEFCDIVERFRELDGEVDRRDMLGALRMMTEEFEHYVVLAEVFEFVLGRKLTPGTRSSSRRTSSSTGCAADTWNRAIPAWSPRWASPRAAARAPSARHRSFRAVRWRRSSPPR